MSDEIKPGDVCEVVACCCARTTHLIGEEVTVFARTSKAIACCCPDCGFITASFFELSENGAKGALPVVWLRKKPPKVDSSQWVRRQTVPLERWNSWLTRVREQKPVESPDMEHA